MSEVSLRDWQVFLDKFPNAHILQSGEWGELKSAFGWKAVRVVAGDGGAQILFRRLPFGLTLAYIPRGPVGRLSQDFWNEVDRACRGQNAVFLKVESDEWESGVSDDPRATSNFPGFQRSPHNIQPPRTLIVDLRGGEDEILARMKQKCRYNVRLAEKKGVTVRAWDNLEAFHRMLLVTGGRDSFGVHSLEYYRKAYELFYPSGACGLLLAEYEGKPIAALMVFAYGKRSWYMYGASKDEERNRMPTYLLQWESMRWARSKGCTEYDLWGVPDEDEETLETEFSERSDGLWSVYRFKRGFGGELKRAVQAYDKIYSPLLFRLYIWYLASRGE